MNNINQDNHVGVLRMNSTIPVNNMKPHCEQGICTKKEYNEIYTFLNFVTSLYYQINAKYIVISFPVQIRGVYRGWISLSSTR